MSNLNVINNSSDDQTVIDKVLFTAKVHVTGGREGQAVSNDGRLNIALSTPGAAGVGTNPEQLFAAGWSACFISAMKQVAIRSKVQLPNDLAVDAEVDLGTGETGFSLRARLNIKLPGFEEDLAKTIIEAAHDTCPYSKATRGNIDLLITVEV